MTSENAKTAELPVVRIALRYEETPTTTRVVFPAGQVVTFPGQVSQAEAIARAKRIVLGSN